MILLSNKKIQVIFLIKAYVDPISNLTANINTFNRYGNSNPYSNFNQGLGQGQGQGQGINQYSNMNQGYQMQGNMGQFQGQGQQNLNQIQGQGVYRTDYNINQFDPNKK